jgi:hypothetical protein
MDLPCETITKHTFRHEMQSSRNTEAALVDNLPIPVENRKRGRPLGSKNVKFKTEKTKKALLEQKALNAHNHREKQKKQKALLASALTRVQELEGEASIEERNHAFIRAVIDRKDKEIAMLLSQNDDSQAEITKLRLLLS